MTLRRLAILGVAVALVGASPALAESSREFLQTGAKRLAAAEQTGSVGKQKTKSTAQQKSKAKAKPVEKVALKRPATPLAASQQTATAADPLPGIFGFFSRPRQPAVSPETQARDAAYMQPLPSKGKKKPFQVDPQYMPQTVPFSGYKAGTIVIDTNAKFLYLVEGWGRARRYGIAVGKEGLEFKGSAKIAEKQEWPRWIPTKEMQEREPKKYGQYKDGMDGGPENPLGARALYLYQGKQDTHIRIHGTTQPWTIGTAASNGCFRMVNEHVIDLYNRVKVGTEVVVL